MNCIVTAGPTYEELDEVRRLTNFSTGALGTELADYLSGRGHNVELLRGYYATCAGPARGAGFQVFTTASDLRQRLHELAARPWDAVFHAAAVSDFRFGKVWTRNAAGELEEIKSAKFSTRQGPLLAELEPTPKILSSLRDWFPGAFLAGWKYEVEGSPAEAIARAELQLVQNRADLCVVNGRAYGQGFCLVSEAGQCRHIADKKELLAALELFL